MKESVYLVERERRELAVRGENVIKIETKSEWSSQRRNEGCYSVWVDVLRVLLRMANTRPYWVRPLRPLEWSGEMSGKMLFIFEQARNGAGYQI